MRAGAGAFDDAESLHPLVDESERDRIGEVVLEQTLSLCEALALLLRGPEKVLEPRRAQRECLALRGPRRPPWCSGVDEDPDRRDRGTGKSEREGVAKHKGHGDADEGRNPPGRCPARAQATRCIGEPTLTNQEPFELVFD